MGEYADELLDAWIDSGESFSTRRPRSKPKPQTCKYCGQGALWWHQMNDGTWRLISYSNDTEMRRLLHSCRTQSNPEFEDPEP